ncbi:hypothetical protein OCA8868_01204 [Octadecabacter ascidiaceicola]|uniref:Major Facilitator Superfamily protein n=2 Tax=Octadecabacter ascidiaceicola TaxID=1655543 RepID=A0A238K256_9RHOB|nr:hypothetical protein OCA8868_01204 [Octadecabacter ascidiaceicola]
MVAASALAASLPSYRLRGGGYGAIAVLSLVGAIPLLFLRIPIPAQRPALETTSRFASLAVLRQIPVLKAVLIGAISQGVMIFMMVPTTLAMIGCGFSEAVAGDVIRWHFIAMFAPSFITGFLIKRFGTRPIVSIGLFFLALAAITGTSGLAVGQFYASLILLGLGLQNDPATTERKHTRWTCGEVDSQVAKLRSVDPRDR